MLGGKQQTTVLSSGEEDLLLRYLRSEDDHEIRLLESELLHHKAGPIISSVLRRKQRVSTTRSDLVSGDEDMYGTVLLEILLRLRELKNNGRARMVHDFNAYVAAITYRVWSDSLRKHDPWRANLKKRLQYMLSREQELAIWKAEGEYWLCGFALWRDQGVPEAGARLRKLLDDARDFEHPQLSLGDLRSRSLVDFVTAVFNAVGGPVGLEDLVRAADRLSATEGRGVHLYESEISDDELRDTTGSVADEVERRMHLQHVWAEILKLPVRQRTALLLNLTDPLGHSAIHLLPAIGIASLREISVALEMSREQLAGLWNELPLDDKRIADYLMATRQQVINLRRTARERLVRRTVAFEKSAGRAE